MRELYLLRHGEAEPYAAGGDAARRLTPRGRAQAEAVGRGLRRVGVQLDAIWHSPYARAVETAGLVSEALGGHKLVEQPGFVPGGDPGRAAIELAAEPRQRLLVVSHLPFLPGLVAELLRAPVRVDLGTADLVSLAILGDGPAFLRAQVPSGWWE